MPKTYRFFTRELRQLPSSGQLRLGLDMENDIFSQLTRVLRTAVGDTVVLLCANGQEHWYSVAAAHKKEVVLNFLEMRENTNELPVPLVLVLCVPNKPDKLSFILQKAVEIGVSEVVLVASDHAQMKHALRMDRLEKIMMEAAEQAERGGLPAVREGGSLKEWLAAEKSEGRIGGAGHGAFFTCAAIERLESFGEKKDSVLSLLDVANTLPTGSSGDRTPRVTGVRFIVGPEGGFSDEEKQLLQQSGVTCFTLGKRILRMETAAVAVLAALAMKMENREDYEMMKNKLVLKKRYQKSSDSGASNLVV